MQIHRKTKSLHEVKSQLNNSMSPERV